MLEGGESSGAPDTPRHDLRHLGPGNKRLQSKKLTRSLFNLSTSQFPAIRSFEIAFLEKSKDSVRHLHNTPIPPCNPHVPYRDPSKATSVELLESYCIRMIPMGWVTCAEQLPLLEPCRPACLAPRFGSQQDLPVPLTSGCLRPFRWSSCLLSRSLGREPTHQPVPA